MGNGVGGALAEGAGRAARGAGSAPGRVPRTLQAMAGGCTAKPREGVPAMENAVMAALPAACAPPGAALSMGARGVSSSAWPGRCPAPMASSSGTLAALAELAAMAAACAPQAAALGREAVRAPDVPVVPRAARGGAAPAPPLSGPGR